MNRGNNFNTNTISSRAPLTTSFFAFIFDFGFKACRGFPVSGADDKDGFDAKSKTDGRERQQETAVPPDNQNYRKNSSFRE